MVKDFTRILCHILITEIPEQGILEFYKTLKDIYEFYSVQNRIGKVSLPQIRQIECTFGTSIIRPEFPVAYDEELNND